MENFTTLKDAIVISERIVKEDIFTSIHIEEYELEVRDTSWVKKNDNRYSRRIGRDDQRP